MKKPASPRKHRYTGLAITPAGGRTHFYLLECAALPKDFDVNEFIMWQVRVMGDAELFKDVSESIEAGETGVAVQYRSFASVEEATAEMRAAGCVVEPECLNALRDMEAPGPSLPRPACFMN
jgi:hypothetical protein